MHHGFRISFLCLLLVIPQHGNSPLPDMPSWVQKNQNDETAKHDLTSSLSGKDETVDFAHQTYQKSFIRGKRSGGTEYSSNERGHNNFNKYSRIKRQPFLYGGHLKGSSESAVGNEKNEVVFEGFGNNPRSSPGVYYFGEPNQRFQNPENINPQYKKFFRENQYVDVIPSQDLLHNNRMNNIYRKEPQSLDTFDKEIDPRMYLQKRLKQRYAPNPFYYYPQAVVDGGLNYPIQGDYVDDGRTGREVRDQEYKNFVGPEGKIPQIFEESEYYDADTSPFLEGEDDYNQLLDNRRYIRKRDEARQAVPGDDNLAQEAFDYRDQDGRFINYAPTGNFRRDNTQFSSIKTRDAVMRPDSNYVWKLDNGLHSQELKDLMKDSQRALQEVQMFQSKFPYKSSENNVGGYKQGIQNSFEKCEKRNYMFDNSRLKREDEDEQKNMKTGTDEGGGEYEDEEGKGHKEEEEYYEDAELSGNDLSNEGLPGAERNQKNVKREILKDANLNRAKNEANDQSEDYELNLENAPVENSGKSKKSTYREGEKTNKNTVRKGVKIWDQWGKWSPCSVTCGVGRSTRWRHCIGGGCAQGEKEAQIKRCTNPAC